MTPWTVMAVEGQTPLQWPNDSTPRSRLAYPCRPMQTAMTTPCTATTTPDMAKGPRMMTTSMMMTSRLTTCHKMYCDGADVSMTRAKTPVQGWRHCGCNTGNNTSATRAKTPARRRMMTTSTTSHIRQSVTRDVAIGQTSAQLWQRHQRKAGGNAGGTRATMPVRRGRRRRRNEGNNASATPVAMTARCWQ
jgi:hypothetical protein